MRKWKESIVVPAVTMIIYGLSFIYKLTILFIGQSYATAVNEFVFSRTFRSIILGQILSLCLVGTGVSSQYLSMEGINAPAGQSYSYRHPYLSVSRTKKKVV